MNSLDNVSILPPQCPPCPLGGGSRGAGGEGEHDHGGVFLLFSGILQTDVLRIIVVRFFTNRVALLRFAFPPHKAEFTFIFPSSEIYVLISHCITNKLKRTSPKVGPNRSARCAVQCAGALLSCLCLRLCFMRLIN